VLSHIYLILGPISSLSIKFLIIYGNLSGIPPASSSNLELFKEPIFKLGVFQDDYIEVELEVYPIVVNDPANEGKKLVAVRFGQMNVVRFVNQDLLYDMKTA